MNKLSKEKRDKLALVCLGVGGLLAVLYFFVISNQRDTLAEIATKLETLDGKTVKADRLLKREADVRREMEERKGQLGELERGMAPPANFYLWFSRLIGPRLQTNSLTLLDLPQPSTNSPGVLPKMPYTAQVFDLAATGYYHDFGKFLADFENDFPYMRVELYRIDPDLGFRSGGGNEGEASLSHTNQLKFRFRVFALQKPAQQ